VDDREVTRAYNAYIDAIRSNDPDGVDELIKTGGAMRVKVGTKVRVIEFDSDFARPTTQEIALLPCDRYGARSVRITEGEFKGKVVMIPTRNLRAQKAKEGQPKKE
jgi:hypothetical protein